MSVEEFYLCINQKGAVQVHANWKLFVNMYVSEGFVRIWITSRAFDRQHKEDIVKKKTFINKYAR